MKKFLSLVLALVMTMSLVTVSAGAKDFTDNDTITYDEAVAVVSEVGIVDGYADGDFKPTNTLTRQAAAKIICNLILGPTTAAELHADTAPYPDVPTTSEFAGYIAFCQSRKIISGYADGTFKPGNTLTGYAFMKMLLGALGYDATLENYTGANWSINVAKQALHIGLNKGLTEDFNGLKAVNREEACLYAFNTLQADLVEYGQRLTTNINGTEVTLSSGGAQSRTWQSQNSRNDNIVKDNIMQFAEEYFNKLVKQDDWTEFMEPAYTWIYDKEEIGTYERVDLIVETYTSGVSGKDAYDLLKGSVIRDNDLEVYVDGFDAYGDGTVTLGGDSYKKIDKTDLVRSNSDDLSITGDGVLTKVYLDTDKDLITIVSIHTWLAQATADYSESREYAPLSVYVGKNNATRNYNVDVEDVANVADVKDETYYLVNISWKDNNTNGELVRINDVEILEDSTVTKFSAGNDGDGTDKVTKLTTGGTEYKANVKAFYDKDVLSEYDQTLLTDNTYNVFVDANGFFIGVELFEGTKNYVFVTGFDRNSSNLSVKTATAAGIFLDGTMKTMEVNVTDTDKNIDKAVKIGDHNAAHFKKWADTTWQAGHGRDGVFDLNQWYTYTVDEGGVYTLKPCVRMTKTQYTTATAIRTDALSVVDGLTANNRVYGEDETVFLTVELDQVDTTGSKERAITEVTGVYTGVQNVDIDIDVTDTEAVRQNQVFTVYDSDYYVIGAVVIGEARGATANYAYITSYAKSEELRDGTYYWTFDAVLNGEHQTLEARSKYGSTINALTKDTVQELRFDGDYVVSIKNLKPTDVYTDFTENLDGEDVYYIDADGKDFAGTGLGALGAVDTSKDTATSLSLQGRTLYVTADRDDVGLGLASDAKAVVIQKENGSLKKTNFNDVKSAVAHLADGGVPYDGKVVAVLNSNGTADWVVFVSNTELTTGNKPIVPPAGKYEDSVKDNTISLALVDTTATLSVLQSRSINALAKAGYRNVMPMWLTGVNAAGDGVNLQDTGYMMATDSDGNNVYFNVYHTNYWTVKVDGKVVDTVLHGNDSTVATAAYVKALTGKGTGFMKDGTTYTKYNDPAITAVTGMTAAVTFETGYAKLTANAANATVTSGGANVNVGGAFKVANGLKIEKTETADAAKDKAWTLTLTGGTGAVMNSANPQIVKADAATPTQDLTWTVNTSNLTSDVADITITGADAPVSRTITCNDLAKDANGIAVTFDAPAAAMDHETVTVEVHITADGSAAASKTVTIAATSGEALTWAGGQTLPSGATFAGAGKVALVNGVPFDFVVELTFAPDGTGPVTVDATVA